MFARASPAACRLRALTQRRARPLVQQRTREEMTRHPLYLGLENKGLSRLLIYCIDIFRESRHDYGPHGTGYVKEGRICRVPYDASEPVDTSWDLRYFDNVAIWLAQSLGFEFRFIDYIQGSQQSLHCYLRERQSTPMFTALTAYAGTFEDIFEQSGS